MARVTIRNLTRRRIPAARSVKRIIARVLRSEGRRGCGVNVIYVGDSLMRVLNRKYTGRASLTDVLAFGMKEGRPVKGAGDLLGDIIISLDAAARQAGRFGSTKNRELDLYLIHGMLHLLGYDDTTPRARARMRRREEELLEGILT